MDLGSWIPSPIEISIGLIGFNLHTDHKHVHILLNNAEKSTMRKLLKPWYLRRKQGVGGSGGGALPYMLTPPPLDPPWAGLHMWPVNEVSQITTHCASHNTFLILFYTNPLISKKLDANWTNAPKSKRSQILHTFPHTTLHNSLM